MKRRDFVRYSSLGVAGGVLATAPTRVLGGGRGPVGTGEGGTGALEPHGAIFGRRPDWEEVRERFAIDRSRIHMGGLFLASHPDTVAEAIQAYRGTLNADPVGSVMARWGWESGVQEMAARYMEADGPDEVGLTGSTTLGLGVLIHGLDVGPGDEVLQTTHEHQVTDDAVAYKADLSGAGARRIDLYDHARPEAADPQEMAERLQAAIRPETRAFVATWVHSSTGVKIPVPALAEVVARANRHRPEAERVVFIVDGVHGLGSEGTAVGELGCDFLSAGTHKWLFGPRGTGVIWGRRRLHHRVKPVIPSVGGGEGWGGRMSPGGFHAFEHRWALDRAFRFHLEIGRERVGERVGQLASRLKEGLAAMDHVRLYTPLERQLSSGIVCFDVDGMSEWEVVDRLLEDHGIIATTTPYRPSHARLTPGLLNDEGEVEACLRAIRAMA